MSRVAVPLLLLIAGVAFAQSGPPNGEVVHACDGAEGEGLTAEGAASAVTDKKFVRVGKGAWRVAPADGVKYYGPSATSIPTRGAATLVVLTYLEGDKPRDFRFFLADAPDVRTQKNAATEYRTLRPGWNETPLGLRDRRTGDGRALDFSVQVGLFQVSKAAEPGDPAVVLDAFLVRDLPSANPMAAREPTADEKAAEKKFVAALAAETDGARRARLVRSDIDALGDLLRVSAALKLLKDDAAPRVRRAAREALARTGGAAGVERLLDGIEKAAGAAKIEALWGLAAGVSTEARAAALRLAGAARTTSPERTALLAGLERKGGDDVAGLLAFCPSAGPWPQRAALVKALRVAATKASVDALIEILADPGSARVAEDAEESLVALTGQDFGPAAATWRDWWAVQRDKVALGSKAKGARTGYATFYGIAIPKGRVAFVLDTSGSMRDAAAGAKLDAFRAKAPYLASADIKTRLDVAKAELAHAIEQLKEGTGVGVVGFSDDRTWLSDGVEKLDATLRARLLKRVQALGAAGKTNVHAGLRSAFFPGKEPSERDWLEGPDTIFLLSDGNPSAGLYADREDLRDEVLAWNLGRAVKIHCVNVGDADVQMLRAWTQSSGGVLLDLRSDRAPAAPPRRP